jgi:hypothetical protein
MEPEKFPLKSSYVSHMVLANVIYSLALEELFAFHNHKQHHLASSHSKFPVKVQVPQSGTGKEFEVLFMLVRGFLFRDFPLPNLIVLLNLLQYGHFLES